VRTIPNIGLFYKEYRDEVNRRENMLEIGIKICKNHQKPINYPMEYRECPACGSEKIIKIVYSTG